MIPAGKRDRQGREREEDEVGGRDLDIPLIPGSPRDRLDWAWAGVRRIAGYESQAEQGILSREHTNSNLAIYGWD